MNKIVAMLHPGEMGAAIGAGFVSRGHRVVWASAGRGATTRKRAQNASLEDMETLARAVQAARARGGDGCARAQGLGSRESLQLTGPRMGMG